MAALDRDTTFVSAVTLTEIARGIAQLPTNRKRTSLADWLHETKLIFADRILPVDAHAAELCGERQGLMLHQGVAVGLADGLIAATARIRQLRVATRNVRDIVAAGAPAYDPWTSQFHEPAP